MRNITAFFLLFVIVFGADIDYAISATYYVDPDSVGGTCNDNGPGTISQPFCSFFEKNWNDKDLSPAAGDIWYFRAGQYPEPIWVGDDASYVFSGTSEQPIKIMPYPGETVIIDGDADGGWPYTGIAIYMPASSGVSRDYIQIIGSNSGGSITIQNWTNGLDVTGTAGSHNGWLIQDITGTGFTGRGFMFRNYDNLTVRNCHLSVLNGVSNESVVFGFRDGCDTVYIYDCIAEQSNDGRGHDGDADGYWSPGIVGDGVGNGPFYIENCIARYVSEDGFDFKDPVTLRNCISHHNTTCGGKFWNALYDVDGFLAYMNGEDGVKLSTTSSGSVFNHITSVANFESGLQIRTKGGYGTVKNSIFALNQQSAINIASLDGTGPAVFSFSNNLYYQSSGYLIDSDCTGNDFTTISAWDTAITTGYTCGSEDVSGSEASTLEQDPNFTDGLDGKKIQSVQISDGDITSDTVIVKQGSNYAWPGYDNSTYIELGWDGTLREVIDVNATIYTLTFTPSVSSTYCGRGTDCDGVEIKDWSTSPPSDLSVDWTIASGAAKTASDTGGEIGFYGYGSFLPHGTAGGSVGFR